MSKIIVRKGMDELTIELENNATAADIASNSLVRTMFDLGDNVQIIRDGFELKKETPLSSGDEVEVVPASNDKG